MVIFHSYVKLPGSKMLRLRGFQYRPRNLLSSKTWPKITRDIPITWASKMAKSQVVDLEDRRLSPFVQCVIYVKKLQKVIGDHHPYGQI